MTAFSMSEVSNQIANILSFFSPGCLMFSIGWGRGGKAVEDLKKKKKSVLQQFVLYEEKY